MQECEGRPFLHFCISALCIDGENLFIVLDVPLLDDVMAAAQRSFPARSQIVEEP